MIINKLTADTTVEFAAMELKKYLRMMMPYGEDVSILSDAAAEDGFRLGLMSDFGLECGDVEDAKYDDILYADCDGLSGIIAGNNPRSVLLSVYEYLRQCGCRWFFPGPDGEYIPMCEPAKVSYRIKPSCRHRGYANTSAASQEQQLEFIDFLPKVGMNTFMFEFRVPTYYANYYYDHKRNERHRPPEHVADSTIMQWKRASETEVAKRGLTFHDVGHGFTIDPFGIDSAISWNTADERIVPDETRKYLAEVKGKRGLYRGVPINTNFCMSNPKARALVADYVADYAQKHPNVDFIHVWLADNINNHCECEQCKKKIPSDWYIDLMNDIDDRMTALSLDTKIVFIAYVDTSWAPNETKIKNEDRFVLMLAPFTRVYYDSMPKNGLNIENPPYVRNKITLAKTLEEYLVYYNDWKRDFGGKALAFEYHFCWAEFRDPSTLGYCGLINDEIRLYKSMGIDGVVEDGDLRPFTPNGVQFYTLARSLFDTSLTADEIIEDYFTHAYGGDWKEFRTFFEKLGNVLDWKYLSCLDSANPKVSKYYNPQFASKLDGLKEVLDFGRELVSTHYTSDIRLHTRSVRMLEFYITLLEGFAEIIKYKALGNDAEAKRLYDDFEYAIGAKEADVERYFNHCAFFNYLHHIVFDNVTIAEFMG